MAARVGLAPTPYGLTNRHAALTPPGNGAAGRTPTCIVPLRRRVPHVFGHGSHLKLVSAAGLAPAVTRSQAGRVAATPRAGCVFRGLSDTDSISCRTAFQFLSDTVPIYIGQRSGLISDSFWASPEGCPRWPGMLSGKGRNRGQGVERRWVNCQGGRSIHPNRERDPNGTNETNHASNSRDPSTQIS